MDPNRERYDERNERDERDDARRRWGRGRDGGQSRFYEDEPRRAGRGRADEESGRYRDFGGYTEQRDQEPERWRRLAGSSRRGRGYGDDESEGGDYGEFGRYGDYGEDRGRYFRAPGERGRRSESGNSGFPAAFYQAEVWTISGPFTGRGPKGYRRSDEKLVEEVCQRLEQHGDIDASEVEVKCQDGVITLEGKVDDRRTKRRAEECAEQVYGVDDVMNHLRIDRGFFQRLLGRDDDEQERTGGRDDKSRRTASRATQN